VKAAKKKYEDALREKFFGFSTEMTALVYDIILWVDGLRRA
jgi:hypothetical protein